MEPTRHLLAFTVWPLPCQNISYPPSPHSFPPQANFYAQYKSIKPYLMKKEKSKTCVWGTTIIGKQSQFPHRLTEPLAPYLLITQSRALTRTAPPVPLLP